MYQPQVQPIPWQGAPMLPPAPQFPFQGFQQQPQTKPSQPPPPPFFVQPQQTVALAPLAPQGLPALPAQAVQAMQMMQSPHSGYFMQYYSPYPGESVTERLGKHILLKLGQVLFQELSNFLGLWKWPPITNK